MSQVRQVSPPRDFIDELLESSMKAVGNMGILIAPDSLADFRWNTVCPIGAVAIVTNCLSFFPKSFSIGFIDGFDMAQPSMKWATDSNEYYSGFIRGRKYRNVFNSK